MGAEGKRKKTKIIPGTQPKARAGWPKRLRLVQTTAWADFAVLSTLFNYNSYFPVVEKWGVEGWRDLDSRITAKYL